MVQMMVVETDKTLVDKLDCMMVVSMAVLKVVLMVFWSVDLSDFLQVAEMASK